MEEPDISVAIPCFNEGIRFPRFLALLADRAKTENSLNVEWVVVDDGSSPDHASKEEAAVNAANHLLRTAQSSHQIKFVRAAYNGGKGHAIRLGWEHASPSAKWLGFLDADGSVSPDEFFRTAQLLPLLRADFVAASRMKMAGRRIERRLFRHLQGRVFASLVSLFFDLDFYDTQCGLKFMRADQLRRLIPQLKEERWMLDLELILRMKQIGAVFQEVPIDWIDTADSRVRFGVDALGMFFSLRRLKQRMAST